MLPSPPHVSHLQREHWNGQPRRLGDPFRFSKSRGETQLQAVCQLWTHNFGWEMRLDVNGELQRSEVFRSQDEALTAAGKIWKAAMVEKGKR